MRLKVEDIKKSIDALNRYSAKPDLFYMWGDDLAAILKFECFETRTGSSVKNSSFNKNLYVDKHQKKK